MTKRNLIIIHRGSDYEQDFDEIARKVNALDRDITIYHLPAHYPAELPAGSWQYPTLTVALHSKFKLPIRRGPVLRNQVMGKLEQQNILRQHGIPTPPAVLFRFGMKIDPIMFGEFVLLKPLDTSLQSKGKGVHVMRRARAEKIAPTDFSRGHPMHLSKAGYLLQKFVHTGEYATIYRVTTLLGRALFAATYKSNTKSPPLTCSDQIIESADFTQKHDRTITFESSDDVLMLAGKVGAAFDSIPLLGIDIVRDGQTSRLYVLEVNPGGNTWHFSSAMWAELRRQQPELVAEMKGQFGAFDIAAEALVEKTRLLAA